MALTRRMILAAASIRIRNIPLDDDDGGGGVPDNALTTEGGDPLTTEDGDILTEEA